MKRYLAINIERKINPGAAVKRTSSFDNLKSGSASLPGYLTKLTLKYFESIVHILIPGIYDS